MKSMLSNISGTIRGLLQSLDFELALIMLHREGINDLILFYCAAKVLGEDILTYENETIQMYFLTMDTPLKNIQKIVMVKSFIEHQDRVLSVPSYMYTAASVFNDEDVNTAIVDYIRPEKLVWFTICMMAITGATNVPITGEALKFFVACLKHDGWTMPPIMLGTQKFTDLFEYYDKAMYDDVCLNDSATLEQCAKNTGHEFNSFADNFREMHKPILQYTKFKNSEIVNTLKKISNASR